MTGVLGKISVKSPAAGTEGLECQYIISYSVLERTLYLEQGTNLITE